MRRRVISLGSLLLAVVALGLVLVNATLVDRRAPGVARISLSAAADGDGTLAQTVTSIDIQFSEPVKPGSVERRFRLVPYVAGTISWDGSTAIFTPSEKLPEDTAFTVLIAEGFEDLAGNVAPAGVEWAFRTVGPPVIASTDPLDGADGVPVDATVTITFDRLMDTEAVESALRIEPAAELRPTWSGQALALTFTRPLQFGTSYTVTIDATAADTSGSQLRAAYETHFSTVAAGLGVDRVVPADGVAGVGVGTPIAVTFDGPIDPTTIGEALLITPPVPGRAEAIALPSDAGPRAGPDASPSPATVLVFRPADPLASHTTYTVSLAPVVSRLDAPGQVAAGRTWTFTTGQPAVSGQNQIAFLSARSGVRNVWLMNPDGSNQRQLTTELVPVAGFDVSADGDQLAWSAAGTIRTRRMDGGDGRTITEGDSFEYAPRFSPDQRSLLVARRDGAGLDLGYWLLPLDATAEGARQILATGAPALGSTAVVGDGVGPTEGVLPWAAQAAFDPAGRRVLITTGRGDVRLVDLEPAEPGLAIVDTGLVAVAGPAWSTAEGRFVVAGRGAGDAVDAIHGVSPDGTTVRLVAGGGTVAVAPDGLLAFVVPDPSGTTRLAIARSTDAGPRIITPAGILSDRSPAFAPDRRLVVFARVRGDETVVSAGIWVIDTATDRLSPLTTDGAYPRWLP
ncbi:MAG TPA: Ig-like domain-containing protein [Candidatus Limnocylindrales bacterium]|nr:Ig-like domain-containing protein [Candidatus Limnocylindrales bacterium]